MEHLILRYHLRCPRTNGTILSDVFIVVIDDYRVVGTYPSWIIDNHLRTTASFFFDKIVIFPKFSN